MKSFFTDSRLYILFKGILFFILRGFFLLQSPTQFINLKINKPNKSRPEAPRHICLGIDKLGPGGAERQICTLARELTRRGYQITVLVMGSLSGDNGHYLPLLQSAGIVVLQTNWRLAICGAIKTGLKLYPNVIVAHYCNPHLQKQFYATCELLFRTKPDILHTYLDFCNICLPLAGLATNVPIIRMSGRNLPPPYDSGIPKQWSVYMREMYHALLHVKRISLEVNTRRGLKEYAEWIGVPPGKIAYVPNGIDETLFETNSEKDIAALYAELGIPPATPVVACVFSLTKRKRPLFAAEIASDVCRIRPEVRFLFIGTGPLKEAVWQFVRDKRLEQNVLFLGTRADVGRILEISNLLLLCSAIEGMPNVIMEAMIFARPVVACNVGGVPDLIDDQTNGMVHELDDKDGMVNSILKLLEDTESAKMMGLSGQKKIRSSFSIHTLGDTLEATYRSLLKEV